MLFHIVTQSIYHHNQCLVMMSAIELPAEKGFQSRQKPAANHGEIDGKITALISYLVRGRCVQIRPPGDSDKQGGWSGAIHDDLHKDGTVA